MYPNIYAALLSFLAIMMTQEQQHMIQVHKTGVLSYFSVAAAARRRDTLPDRILYILVVVVVVGYKSQSWSLCQYVNVSQIHIFIYISTFIVFYIVIVSPIHRFIH